MFSAFQVSDSLDWFFCALFPECNRCQRSAGCQGMRTLSHIPGCCSQYDSWRMVRGHSVAYHNFCLSGFTYSSQRLAHAWCRLFYNIFPGLSINQSINQSLFQAETHRTNNKENVFICVLLCVFLANYHWGCIPLLDKRVRRRLPHNKVGDSPPSSPPYNTPIYAISRVWNKLRKVSISPERISVHPHA